MKFVFKVSAAVGLALAAVPSLADQPGGFGVAVAAGASNVYTQDGYVSAFRTGKDSSFNFTRPGDIPSYHQDGCNYAASQNVTCSGGASGTQGTDYNLTAATASAGLTDDVGYQPPTFASGSADARSSLATGEIGAQASSDIFREVRGGPTFIGAAAFAQFNDTLTFNVAGAGNSTITNIGVEFILDGALTVSNLRGGAGITNQLYFGQGFAQYFAQIGNGNPAITFGNGDRNWISSSWDVGTPGQAHFTGIYALSGPSSIIGIANSLYAYAGGGASSNYYNTSKIALTLPTGVSYTSASGKFLSARAVSGAVPEPATWMTMILGFGLIGYALRRRRVARPALAVQ